MGPFCSDSKAFISEAAKTQMSNINYVIADVIQFVSNTMITFPKRNVTKSNLSSYQSTSFAPRQPLIRSGFSLNPPNIAKRTHDSPGHNS